MKLNVFQAIRRMHRTNSESEEIPVSFVSTLRFFFPFGNRVIVLKKLPDYISVIVLLSDGFYFLFFLKFLLQLPRDDSFRRGIDV